RQVLPRLLGSNVGRRLWPPNRYRCRILRDACEPGGEAADLDGDLDQDREGAVRVNRRFASTRESSVARRRRRLDGLRAPRWPASTPAPTAYRSREVAA